ncbi:hypothetical protein FXW78_09790 [Rhodococcus opacus]|nr:hypothetical protein [Rhodococcus opacus]
MRGTIQSRIASAVLPWWGRGGADFGDRRNSSPDRIRKDLSQDFADSVVIDRERLMSQDIVNTYGVNLESRSTTGVSDVDFPP